MFRCSECGFECKKIPEFEKGECPKGRAESGYQHNFEEV